MFNEIPTPLKQESSKVGLARVDLGTAIQSKTDKIVVLLEDHGPMTRKDIMQLSGYAWSTIYDALYRLEIKGKVSRYSQRIKRGRPRVFWKYNNY